MGSQVNVVNVVNFGGILLVYEETIIYCDRYFNY